jgi:hypothetical protein
MMTEITPPYAVNHHLNKGLAEELKYSEDVEEFYVGSNRMG